MNLETKITIYKFTPQLFTLTRNMGTDLFIKAHAVYSYAKVSALTRIASALLLSITIFLGWIDVYIR